MIKNKLLAVGVTSAIALAGCGESTGPVKVTSKVDADVYQDPFVDSEPTMAGVLKAGSRATAICFQETKVSQYDAVRIKTAEVAGYVLVNGYDGSKDETPSPSFDLNTKTLKEKLPAC